MRRKLLTEPKDASRGPRSGRARVPSVDARGVSARPRTARESGGVERVASRKSPEKRRTCSLVKLLIRASGVFLLTNLAKSGCTLHRARISPNRNPEANADSNESTCCVTPTSSRSHRRRSSDIVRAAARPGVLARALLSEGSNPNESSHANPKQERARVVDGRSPRVETSRPVAVCAPKVLRDASARAIRLRAVTRTTRDGRHAGLAGCERFHDHRGDVPGRYHAAHHAGTSSFVPAPATMRHFATLPNLVHLPRRARRTTTDRPLPPPASGPPFPRLPQAGTASVVDPEGAKAAFQPPADENERPTTPPEIAKCVPLDRRVSSGEKHARLTDRPDERRRDGFADR